MNKWKDVAKMFDLELDEVFDLEYENGEIRQAKFTSRGVEVYSCGWGLDFGIAIHSMLSGKCKIIRKPWKPKNGEKYWYWNVLSREAEYIIFDEEHDRGFEYWKIPICFRTKEEAEDKGKKIMDKLRAEYKGV